MFELVSEGIKFTEHHGELGFIISELLETSGGKKSADLLSRWSQYSLNLNMVVMILLKLRRGGALGRAKELLRAEILVRLYL